jgi:ribosome biogenesis protein MAK21
VDRFYRALYSKLTLSDVGATSKDSILLNLLFRAIKHDPDATRARAVIKRLVQVALHQPAAFAAGVVLLVAELARSRAAIKDMLTVPEVAAAAVAAGAGAAAAVAGGAGGGTAAPVDKAAAGADSESEEEDGEAAEKEGDSKAAAGGEAFVLPTPEEKARALRLLQSMAVEGGDEEDGKPAAGKGAGGTDRTVSFDGPSAAAATAAAAAGTAAAPRIRYDPLKRDPRYAGAEASCLWELAPLALHFHPSVRKFADDVLASPGAPVAYGGDPLSDFTLMAFLDRYMYKNPKQRFGKGEGEGEDKAGAQAAAAAALLAAGDDAALSREQIAAGYAMVQQGVDPAALLAKGGAAAAGAGATSAMQKRAPKHGRADTEAPANTAEFAARDPGAVAEEDRFMHTFFRTQASMDALRPSAAKRRRTEAASDDEEAEGAAADGAHAAGEGDEAADSDAEEAEMDAFADKLADDLLRTAAGGADPDPDDDEWLDEEGAPAGDPFAAGRGAGAGDEEDDGGDDFGDGDEEEDDASEGGEGSEGEDGDEGLEEASEEEDEAPVAAGKGRKALANGGGGVFADADDFAEALAEEEGRYEAAFASRFGAAEGSASGSSSAGKKAAGPGAAAAAGKFGGPAVGAGGGAKGGKPRPGRGGGGAGRGRVGGFGGAGRGRGGSRGGSSHGGGSRGFRGGGRR